MQGDTNVRYFLLLPLDQPIVRSVS